MKHTQTATVREMRTLVNTCQKHAESSQRGSNTAEDAAWRATRRANESTDAAKRAERAAAHAEKLLRINIITLMTITAISVAAFILVLI
jgi:hypothetical protein